MSFAQLHYTSCENGLANYSGFQFCAITSGVRADLMREVERLTVYEPPRSHTSSPVSPAHEFPINLLYTIDDSSGNAIIARVKYTGTDFSNRPGNYFAHALVTGNPLQDFFPLFPVELWEAPFWVSSQGPESDLPPLPSPPPRGPITRTFIADFIASEPTRSSHLRTLLSMANSALFGGQKVMLVAEDAHTICHWIAAISYLLGPSLAMRLTFSTYSYDPGRFRTHLVGMIASTKSAHSIGPTSHQVFDLATGASPTVSPSAAASLLVRLGVMAALDLWSLAIPFGASPERPLDEIFPVLASAALVSGYQLTIDELDAAIEWLSSTDGEATSYTDVAIKATLKYSLADLPVARQEQLSALAARSDGQSLNADGSLTSQVECLIVRSTLKLLDSGASMGAGFLLRSPKAKAMASAACSRTLPSAGGDQAIRLLVWASAVGAKPDDDVLHDVARDIIIPGLAENIYFPELPGLASHWPALRTAMASQIAALPVGQQRKIVFGPAGMIFDVTDFIKDARLSAEWIAAAARQDAITRTEALVLASHVHNPADGTSIIDQHLLSQLWGKADWTISESSHLLNVLPVNELRRDLIVHHLMAALHGAPPRDVDEWIEYIRALAALSSDILPIRFATEVAEIISDVNVLCRPGGEMLPEEIIYGLLERYPHGSPSYQMLLDARLPRILLMQIDLHQILRRCPRRLFDCFCDYAREEMTGSRLELTSIAFLAIAMLKLRNHRGNYGELIEKRVLLPVLPAWKRRDITALGNEMEYFSPGTRNELDQWHWRHVSKNRFLCQHRRKA